MNSDNVFSLDLHDKITDSMVKETYAVGKFS